jgi:hypothetical protein
MGKVENMEQTITKFIKRIGTFFLTTWIVQLCWNYAAVYLFEVPKCGYWRAAVLIILIRAFGKPPIQISTNDKTK